MLTRPGLLARPSWHAEAACGGRLELMYGAELRQAKRVCTACPVRGQCLVEALERRERHGVWGGLSTSERENLLRSLRSLAARAG